MNRFLGIFFAVLLCATAQHAFAATLYMDPSQSTLSRADTEIVSVRLDTDSVDEVTECINAVEGVLDLTGPAKAVDISLGDSIFAIWIETPTISQNGKQVTFAGGIPNGYCGRIEGDPRLTNILFDVIVRIDSAHSDSGEIEEVTIDFSNQTKAYLNDGFGTKANLQTFAKAISVLPTIAEETLDPWQEMVGFDTQSPQEFSVDLSRDDTTFAGRYYITFNTVDKQTGIDRYEVIEEPLAQFGSFLWGRATAPWKEVRSPYVLKDQTLNSVIRVKAVDKAGNEYIASILPDEELRTVSFVTILLVVLLAISFLMLLYGLLAYRRRQLHVREQRSLDRAFGTTMAGTDISQQFNENKQELQNEHSHTTYDKNH